MSYAPGHDTGVPSRQGQASVAVVRYDPNISPAAAAAASAAAVVVCFFDCLSVALRRTCDSIPASLPDRERERERFLL